MPIRSCKRSSSYPVLVAAYVASSLWLPATGCSGTIDGTTDAHHDHAAASGSGSGGMNSAAGGDDDGDMSENAGSGGTQGQAGNASKPQATCDDVAVGATPLQRLTRDEYGNSVRDLLDLPSVDVSGIAQDERVGPFSGNNVAPVSDLIVEQYLSAAEKSAKTAADAGNLEKLVTCDRDALGDEACADQFVKDFGLRVYRRPLDDDELDAYHALFTSYAADGYTEALRVIVQTMLQSPNFLYRVELLPPAPGSAQASAAAAVDLDAYELATRLSFFLVRTTPDAALLRAAAAGDLDSTDALRKQAQRLLDDARSRATLTSFHVQWLELDALSALTKDADVYPAFDAELAKAMQHETERFVDYVVRDGEGTLEALLTAPYSFLEGPLFDLYGVKAPAGAAADDKIQLDPAERAGLLTQASFLSVHGHTNQSAPVQRGKVVIRNVLCEALPDPPPNVNTTPPAPSPDATTRQRFAAHEKDSVCAGCHVRIDGVGMGFENYDGIGAFRTRDGDQNVDASGKLVSTIDLDGEFDGAVELAKKLAKSQEVSDCVATQWLRYSLGRFETKRDTCSLTGIKEAFDASGHDIRALLEAIVVSDAFRKKAASAEDAP